MGVRKVANLASGFNASNVYCQLSRYVANLAYGVTTGTMVALIINAIKKGD